MDIATVALTATEEQPLAGGWMSYCRLATEQPVLPTAFATRDKESKVEHDHGH